ncbi:NECA1 protein, partial [Amia calva]|nr:NECA1 protein [Amia calva]
MKKTKELSVQKRQMVVDLHKSGNGYKKIHKLLNLPLSTVRAIINKFKRYGTVKNLTGRTHKCILEYQSSSTLGQFVTRFLLRETSSQLHSLQMSLECAMEAVEDQSCQGRKDGKKAESLSVQRPSRRCGRRIQKNLCLSPTDPYSGMLTSGVSVEPDNHWASQINRLQQLIDKLECKSPKLEPVKDDTFATPDKSSILLVQRQMSVMEKDMEEFRRSLRRYTDATAGQSANLHISVQKLPEKLCFIMFEFWQDRISWMRYRCVIGMHSI